MKVVVVESPAKAKTINKYLGSDYKVVASYGHVRDLPAKDGSVLPDADFAMSWEVDGKSEKHLKTILEAARSADRLFLATDPDREGEAISWHVREVLKARRALKDVDVKRVVFNEVTRNAVLNAFRHPREIDTELVEAYLARRALDYLVGFTLSPVLWRKLPGSRSAGRVQSVALRLVCEREAEIEAFKAREYWTVEAIAGARELIGTEYGGRYVPPEPRVYRTQAKNAQEAHEAIRPTDMARKPGDVAQYLDSDHRRLYELIWKRTVASQMASAVLDQVAVDIADPSGRLRLHATGSVVVFDGFLKLYQEDRDDTGEEESESRRLPKMRDGERLARGTVDPSQHFTQPPPRYSEASLVKKLEELGIGRPSTYASIIQ